MSETDITGNPFIKKVERKVFPRLPTIEELDELIVGLRKRLRKEKYPDRKQRLKIILTEMKSLRDNLI